MVRAEREGSEVRKIGYARVSTSAQDTALQTDALAREAVDLLYWENCSGVSARPELQRALDCLGPGDLLVVWKLDRIARSLPDLLRILERLRSVGATIKSLTEPIDTSTPIGEFTIQILGAVAQLERSMIRERIVAGQIAAKARGKKWGTKPHTTPELEERLIAWFVEGGRTVGDAARQFGIRHVVARRVIRSRFPPSLYSPPGRPKNGA